MTATGAAPQCPICDGTTRPCWRRAWPGAAGTTQHDLRPNADRFGVTIGPVWRCRSCGHRFVAQTSDLDAAVTYEPVEGDGDPAAAAGSRLTYVTRTERLLARDVGPRILEIGCWDARQFSVYVDRGLRPIGIEPSTWACAQAWDLGHDVRCGALPSVPGLDSHALFDAVLMFDVIEHVWDPRALYRSALRLVRPGGHLVLTTPRASSLVARSLQSHWWSVMPMHLHYFTDRSLREVVRREGRDRATSWEFEPKRFPLSYYAERLQHLFRLQRSLVAERSRLGRRAIAPNFRDRRWLDIEVA